MLTEEYVRYYADSVYKLCSFYAGSDEEARDLFRQTFVNIDIEVDRSELFIVAHDCCVNSIKEKNYSQKDEIWLYEELLGMTKAERKQIMRGNGQKLCQSCHFFA